MRNKHGEIEIWVVTGNKGIFDATLTREAARRRLKTLRGVGANKIRRPTDDEWREWAPVVARREGIPLLNLS